MAKRRTNRKRRKLKDEIEYFLLVAVCAVFLLTALSYVINPPPVYVPENTQLKAALVDQLSVTQPNKTFTV